MSRIVVLTDSRYTRQRMPAALIEALRRPGHDVEPEHEVEVLIADHKVAEIPGDWTNSAKLRDGDLVVPRTRHPFGLALLCRANLDGVPAVNPWIAVQAVRDKPHAACVLAQAGVPMPRTFLTDRPSSLAALPSSAWPVLLKPAYGDNGRGIVLVESPEGLRRLGWNDRIVLAQHFVDVAGVDVKLYGAGDHVWAVRRSSPLLFQGWDDPEPVPVTNELRALARACREAFGLELYGVDVLPSDAGPLVVDVNDFPNYTGIPDAPEVIATVVGSFEVTS
jgi:ribosomal protein S6--L-glutamate ligase